jgi:FSR family fosmidomycin resistance protein-like MFS transporter
MDGEIMAHPTATSPTPAALHAPAPPTPAARAAFHILAAVSLCHLLNDMVQSLLPSIYPILKVSFHLNFGQIGLISLVYQVVASLLQPFIGLYTDRRPMPYALAIGMCFTLLGIALLATASSFNLLLMASAVVGIGSAIVLPEGQPGVAWFSIAAVLGIIVLIQVGRWRSHHLSRATPSHLHIDRGLALPRRSVIRAVAVLAALIFSKYFYLASMVGYFTFYLITRFHVSVRSSQLHLFVFLGAAAAGTFFGGPIGDRIGPRYVIWGSILGVLPFTLMLPYANLFWTGVLSALIGFVIASAFSAIVVYAQELMPGRVGLVSGIFFGLAFGMGGIGAAVLGHIADLTSIVFVYKVCAWLPAIGLLAGLLPNLDKPQTV